MWPLGHGRRRLWPNSDEPTAGSAGEVVGEACELTRDQFAAGVGWNVHRRAPVVTQGRCVCRGLKSDELLGNA
jgi:hypothetical protein